MAAPPGLSPPQVACGGASPRRVPSESPRKELLPRYQSAAQLPPGSHRSRSRSRTPPHKVIAAHTRAAAAPACAAAPAPPSPPSQPPSPPAGDSAEEQTTSPPPASRSLPRLQLPVQAARGAPAAAAVKGFFTSSTAPAGSAPVAEVVAWLRRLGLATAAAAAEANGICGEVLRSLDEEDLGEALGLTRFGDRRRVAIALGVHHEEATGGGRGAGAAFSSPASARELEGSLSARQHSGRQRSGQQQMTQQLAQELEQSILKASGLPVRSPRLQRSPRQTNLDGQGAVSGMRTQNRVATALLGGAGGQPAGMGRIQLAARQLRAAAADDVWATAPAPRSPGLAPKAFGADVGSPSLLRDISIMSNSTTARAQVSPRGTPRAQATLVKESSWRRWEECEIQPGKDSGLGVYRAEPSFAGSAAAAAMPGEDVNNSAASLGTAAAAAARRASQLPPGSDQGPNGSRTASDDDELMETRAIYESRATLEANRRIAFEKLKKDMQRKVAFCCEEYGLKTQEQVQEEVEEIMRVVPETLPDDMLRLTLRQAWRCAMGNFRSRFSNSTILDHRRVLSGSGSQIINRVRCLIFRSFFLWGVVQSQITISDLFHVVIMVLFTWLCIWKDIIVDVNPGLFIGVVVFPLAFSVNSAYVRRENALMNLADMRACGVALFGAHRAWRDACSLPHLFVVESGDKFRLLFHYIDHYLRCIHNEERKLDLQRKIYDLFDALLDDNEIMRRSQLAAPLLTRPIHELQQIMSAFERLRTISDYRTPCSIRAYTQIAVIMMNLLLAPYFANLSVRENYSKTIVFVLAAFFAFFFLMLVSVQEMLEEPFGKDFDDIHMGVPLAIVHATARAEEYAAKQIDPDQGLTANSAFLAGLQSVADELQGVDLHRLFGGGGGYASPLDGASSDDDEAPPEEADGDTALARVRRAMVEERRKRMQMQTLQLMSGDVGT